VKNNLFLLKTCILKNVSLLPKNGGFAVAKCYLPDDLTNKTFVVFNNQSLTRLWKKNFC